MTDIQLPTGQVIEWVPIESDLSQWGLKCPVCKQVETQDPLPQDVAEHIREDCVRDFAQRHAACLSGG